MHKCQSITIRRTWCDNYARPGFTTCAAHAAGPWFNPTQYDYATANTQLRELEYAGAQGSSWYS